MLTKILLTALVIGAVYLYLRRKRERVALGEARPFAAGSAPQPFQALAFRRLAGALLLLSLLGASAFFVHRWYDDQTLLNIRVINSTTGDVVLYQAYKGDLEGRSFVTVYGQSVSIAGNERMEIQEER